MEGQGLQQQENGYLNYIVPNLFTIASQVKDIIGASLIKINKLYYWNSFCNK